MRTLIFLFDGTWNGWDDEHPTNILKLHHGLSNDNQVSFYFTGPGNEDEHTFIGELIGGAFGVGSWEIRNNAVKVFESVYQIGDRVAALGFSRGAAIARMFCSAIEYEVEFLGCFDTVGAYLPIGPSQQGLFHDLSVAEGVKAAYHAVALDEDRKTFEPNLMNMDGRVEEVWFRGVHSDIGGGFKEQGLSDTCLEWMAERLAEHDIEYDDDHYPLQPDYSAPIGDVGGFYRREKRRVGVKYNDEWSSLSPTLYGDLIKT